jgi:single-strand DNA-binding protein
MSNSISFMGRLGADAEMREINGMTVVNFNVANRVGWGDHESTIWFRCALWGKRGEAICGYLTKGTRVVVHGELELREYQNKDGQTSLSPDVRVHNLDFAGGGDHTEAKPQAQRASGQDFNDDIPF